MYSIIYDEKFIAEAHDAEVFAAGKAKGKAEGEAKGKFDTIKELLALGLLTPKAAQAYSDLSNSKSIPQN